MMRLFTGNHAAAAIALLTLLALPQLHGQQPSPRGTKAEQLSALVSGVYRLSETDTSNRATLAFIRLLAGGVGTVEKATVSDIAARLQVVPLSEVEPVTWDAQVVEGSGTPRVCLSQTSAFPRGCWYVRVQMPHRDLWLYEPNDELQAPSYVLLRLPPAKGSGNVEK